MGGEAVGRPGWTTALRLLPYTLMVALVVAFPTITLALGVDLNWRQLVYVWPVLVALLVASVLMAAGVIAVRLASLRQCRRARIGSSG
ncbi:hypothetical protein [Nonomuraea sp. SYSU D8015]|uniref:hypothetical protein n=1 Tax=Nonomuraea sp. SYSU D8015 TaxID=2593644 RepID=UPI0016604240|nr:hypothetical protein [Nonomuraea sp. SYSU D8015]